MQNKCPTTCATNCISSCPRHCCTAQATPQPGLVATPMPVLMPSPPPPPPPPAYFQPPQATIYQPPPPVQYAPAPAQQQAYSYNYNYNAQCPTGCHSYCAGHCPVYCCPQRQQSVYTNPMTRGNFPMNYSNQQRTYARSVIGNQLFKCPLYCNKSCLPSCPVQCCTKLNILKYLAKKISQKKNIMKRAKSLNMLQPPPMSLTPRKRSSSGACPIACATRCTKACARECCASRPNALITSNIEKRDKIGTTNVNDIEIQGTVIAIPFSVKQDLIIFNTNSNDLAYSLPNFNYFKHRMCILHTDCHGGVPTFGGNGSGACCFFPFIYNEKVYNHCTRKDSVERWCSTTPIYDVDKKWGMCIW